MASAALGDAAKCFNLGVGDVYPTGGGRLAG